MKEYKCYDTDITYEKEYDIIGKDYEELIQTCCKYCTTFSVILNHSDCSLLDKLEPFRIHRSDRLQFVYGHYCRNVLEGEAIIRYYHVCPQLQQAILSISKSIFSWVYAWGYTNPEDPTFYREDGSIFFSSIVHEGECTLFVRNDENVDNIVANSHWNIVK